MPRGELYQTVLYNSTDRKNRERDRAGGQSASGERDGTRRARSAASDYPARG